MHVEDSQTPGVNNTAMSVDAGRTSHIPLPVIIISIIFTAEFLVMVLLDYISPLPEWIESLLDPFLLIVFLYPLLNVFVFGPQRKHVAKIMAATSELEEARARTEQHVIERTEELQRVNDSLSTMLKKMEMHERESALMIEMVNFLHACKTQEEAYAVLTRISAQLFPEYSGSLNVYNASRNFIVNVAHWGEDPEPDQGFGTDECWALRRGSPYQSGVSGWPCCQHFKSKDITAALCVPLIADGTGLGNLVIQTKDTSSAASRQLEETLLTVQTAAGYIALALSNIQLRETLHGLSIRDPLTGLFNRRYLEETLEREMLRAQRRGSQFALLMMDVDHFKKFNDTYGHDIGDALLRELGTCLNKTLRGEDIACRYGGEEFVIVLTDIKMDEARKRAEDLRNCTRNIIIMDHDGKIVEPVTLSIGLTLFPDHGENQEALIKAADQALYSAKNAGRNRVVCAGMESRDDFNHPQSEHVHVNVC